MYKIMTDSECGLPKAFLNQHEVGVVRSFVQLEDHQFGDYFYNQQNMAAFYDTLKRGEHPITSQVSIGEYVAAFEEYYCTAHTDYLYRHVEGVKWVI